MPYARYVVSSQPTRMKTAYDRHSRRYFLAAHIYACPLPQGTVLLDLQRNRYFAMEARVATAIGLAAAPAFDQTAVATPLTDTWNDSMAANAHSLIASNVLQTTPASARDFDPGGIDMHVARTIDDCGGKAPFLHPHQLARFLLLCARVHRDLRTRTLYEIACEIHAKKGRCAQIFRTASLPSLRTAIGRFRRLRPYAFAAHDQCLFHALVLMRYLIAQDLFATWVIGVRLRPWGAHSWVQYGSTLLDCTPESVREFKPIIAV